MVLKSLGVGLLILSLYALYKVLITRYYSHWKPWVGVGWLLSYDHDTGLVTVATFLLKSPVGWADIKRGSILLARNGEKIPTFAIKEDFTVWLRSVVPVIGRSVTYTLREPLGNDEWCEREVTLWYETLRGNIPLYAPLPTHEQMHQDWKDNMPTFKIEYPTFRCPRTGVIYHRKKVIPVEDF